MNTASIRRSLEEGMFWKKVVRRLLLDREGYRLLAPLWLGARVVPNKIVCASFNGQFHTDNPALIADELLSQRPDLDIVWLVSDAVSPSRRGAFRVVPFHSWYALWELATARIWINNVRMMYPIAKKRTQFYVQTWHSCFGVKTIEKDAADTLPPRYWSTAQRDSRICDLMLSGNRWFSDLCRSAFLFKGELLKCGEPRLDNLFCHDEADASAMRTRLGLGTDETVVLYAPTFRKDFSASSYITDFSMISDAFGRRTGRATRFLLKFHPNAEQLFKSKTFSENVRVVKDVPNIQELYAISDFLITDYSSVMFEFALLGKPVFLYMNDFAEYTKERKLCYSLSELPFPIAFSLSELAETIKNSEAAAMEWQAKVEQFFRTLGLYEIGKATQSVVDRILRELPPESGVQSKSL